MKYYRRRTGSRIPKPVFRVFFVICAALVITLITSLIGNFLKVKIENAEAESESIVPILPEEKNDGSGTDFNLISMNGVGLNLGAFGEQDALVLKINSIEAGSVNTLILGLSGDAGDFVYSSPALSKALRQPSYDDAGGKFALLTSAVSAAKAKNLTVCALIEPSLDGFSPKNGAFVDSIIINELHGLGVSHVLIKLPSLTGDESGEEMDYRDIQAYAAALEISGCAVGFGLNSGFISGSDGMKLIQNLEDYAAFCAVYFDFSDGSLADDSEEAVLHELNSLVGLFSVYNMHVLIEDNIYASVVYRACVSAGADNICFEGDIPSAVGGTEDETEAETTAGKTSSALDEEEKDKTSNPYASRSDGTRDSETEVDTDTNVDIDTEPPAQPWEGNEPGETEDYGYDDENGGTGGTTRWY